MPAPALETIPVGELPVYHAFGAVGISALSGAITMAVEVSGLMTADPMVDCYSKTLYFFIFVLQYDVLQVLCQIVSCRRRV